MRTKREKAIEQSEKTGLPVYYKKGNTVYGIFQGSVFECYRIDEFAGNINLLSAKEIRAL